MAGGMLAISCLMKLKLSKEAMMQKQDEVLKGGENFLPPTPFANYALKYFNLDFSIIPCEGKKPLIAWKKYQKTKPKRKQVENWINKFPNANIGIIAGQISNLTIIDCDDPLISLEDLEAEFGKSNFAVKSPSGGLHLYYQFADIKKAIKFDGRKIDVISDGGFIIAPYSYNEKKKAFYSVFKGNFDDFNGLTNLNKNSIKIGQKSKVLSGFQVDDDLKIEEGARNNNLFRQLIKIAPSIKDYSTLEKRAFEINLFALNPSLNESEVITTTKSAWKLKVSGQLFGSDGGASISRNEAERLMESPRAFVLLWNLKFYHEGVRKQFNISQVEFAKKLGWNRKTLKQAIDVLIKNNIITRLESKKAKNFRDNKIKTPAYEYRFYRW
jgi:hypothetical protein